MNINDIERLSAHFKNCDPSEMRVYGEPIKRADGVTIAPVLWNDGASGLITFAGESNNRFMAVVHPESAITAEGNGDFEKGVIRTMKQIADWPRSFFYDITK